MQRDTDVLIVGAGPTGLALALWLAQFGVKLRIVDQAAVPGTTSRALVLHARILEFYEQLGLAQDIVAQGVNFAAANLWVGGERKARLYFGDMGKGISPFPYALVFPQDEHERFLIDRLAARGIAVERPVTAVAMAQRADGVTVRLPRADGFEESVEAAYVAGCDGTHSFLRKALGLDFAGGTYSHIFYVADVQATGRAMNGELNLALDDAEFLAIFPLKGAGRARFIGTVKRDAEARTDLTFADVSPRLLDRLDIAIERVNWFSTYRVHHRVAARFSDARAFLLGDAAHIHSPVGGQGLNTGIGDAVNLAWKLAAVLQGNADATLLDSYAPERSAFARRLVATTDRAFQFINNDGALARLVRVRLVPLLLPALFRLHALRRLMFKTVSQTNVHYRASPLSTGAAGRVSAGDRLPWLRQPDGTDNFAALRDLSWQAHVYGDASDEIARACREAALELHRFSWSEAAHAAGLARGALYLIRPDGYVGLAAAGDAAAKLRDYQARWHLRFVKA
jgi:2-polyprenyl-6-methoxyphenol hydroxylase-like FAD-dependent oxidoreductase